MENVNGLVKKNITTFCPYCGKRVIFGVNADLVERSPLSIVPLLITHCGHRILVYVDRNFSVRSVEKNIIDLDYDDIPVVDASRLVPSRAPVSPEEGDSVSPGRRIYYVCNSVCETYLKKGVPNIIERRLLNLISRKRRIEFGELMGEALKVADALGIGITPKMIIELLDKYVEEGIITREGI